MKQLFGKQDIFEIFQTRRIVTTCMEIARYSKGYIRVDTGRSKIKWFDILKNLHFRGVFDSR